MTWTESLERQWAEAERRRDAEAPEDLPPMPTQDDFDDGDRAYEQDRQRCTDGDCDHEGCCRSGTG